MAKKCPACGSWGHTTSVSGQCKKRAAMAEDPEQAAPAAKKVRRCKHCGGTDHQRKSSHLCRAVILPLPSQTPPYGPLAENEFFHKVDGGTIKKSLNQVIKCHPLKEKISAMVQALTAVEYDATRLLNLHMLHVLENNLEMPELDKEFILQFFQVVQKHPDDLAAGICSNSSRKQPNKGELPQILHCLWPL